MYEAPSNREYWNGLSAYYSRWNAGMNHYRYNDKVSAKRGGRGRVWFWLAVVVSACLLVGAGVSA